jgi:hypothetical protein
MRYTHAFILTASLFSSAASFAQNAEAETAANSSEYYTIHESDTNHIIDSTELAPQEMMSWQAFAAQMQSFALNLLRWTLHAEPPKPPTEAYNRKMHFGRWINDRTDDTCFNTRAKVLIRDADGTVHFKETNHCIVNDGTWNDPYTGEVMHEVRDIQIDHVVPLKDAYMSGAWEWNYQMRCLYANYLGNNFHLLSVNGIENMKKGDSAPDHYMPPNQAFRCQYLEDWLKIKLIWQLKMTPSEVRMIRQTVRENHCDTRRFSLSEKELRAQRKFINDHINLCSAH